MNLNNAFSCYLMSLNILNLIALRIYASYMVSVKNKQNSIFREL